MPTDPLEELRATIASARELPPAEPYVPASEPLRKLKELIFGAPQAAPPPPVAPPSDRREIGAIDALVGRELLELVAAQPLGADAREEAVRRLVLAMQNPEPDTLRSVLRVLIANRVDA